MGSADDAFQTVALGAEAVRTERPEALPRSPVLDASRRLQQALGDAASATEAAAAVARDAQVAAWLADAKRCRGSVGICVLEAMVVG